MNNKPQAEKVLSVREALPIERFVEIYDDARGHEIRHSTTTLAFLRIQLLAAIDAALASVPPSPPVEPAAVEGQGEDAR